MAKKKAAGEEGEAASGKAPGKSKRMLLVAGAALVLLGGGAGGYLMLRKPAHAEAHGAASHGSGHGSGHGEAHAEAGGHGPAAAEAKKPVVFLDVRDMIVNLGAEPGKPKASLLRLRVALELKDARIEQDVKPLLPRVEDAFQVYMRELRASDLAGSAGLYRLREEMLRRVNVAIYPAKAEAVLFKEVVVQDQ